MAKKPGDRHSAVNRDPVTIDLDGDDVKRLDESDTGDDGGAPEAAEPTPMTPDEASEADDIGTSPGDAPGSGDEDEGPFDREADAIADSDRAEPPVADNAEELQSSADDTAPFVSDDENKDETGIADQTVAVSGEPEIEEAKAASAIEDGEARDDDPSPVANDEPADSAPASPPTRSGGMGGVSAFLLGALLVALGLGTAIWFGYIPLTDEGQTSGAEIERLQQEIDTLRTEIASRPEPEPADGPQAEEIAALQTEMQQLRETVSSGGAGEEAGLQALSDRVSALETAEPVVASDPDAQRTAAAMDETMAELDQRVAGLREELAGLQQNLENAANERAGTATRLEESFSTIGESFDRLSASLTDMQEQFGAASVNLSDLENRVEKVEQVAEAASAQENVARAIAASALRSAVENGQPFENELQTAKTLGADGASVSALEPHAATGVKTEAQLAAAVPDVADAMRDAVSPSRPAAQSTGSLFDQLRDGAKSLVKIRKVGDVAGEGPESTITRFENAVMAGELEAALTEYEALPAEAQQVGDAFADDLRATVEARASLPEVIAAISAPGPASGTPAPASEDAAAQPTETGSENGAAAPNETPEAPDANAAPATAPAEDAAPPPGSSEPMAGESENGESIEPATSGTEQTR